MAERMRQDNPRVPSSIPRSNSLSCCHNLRKGGAVAMDGGIVNDSRKHEFCWSLRNPFKQGTCTSLLSHSDGTLNQGLFWLDIHSIWSELKDPGTPPRWFRNSRCSERVSYQTDTQHAQVNGKE